MKKIIAICSITLVFFASCKKDDPDPVSTLVTVSYPTVTLNGPAFVYIPVGGTYTELGATLVDDITGASSQIGPTTRELDVNTPGLYAMTYVASNSNGFKSEAVRGVLVLNYTPPGTLDPNFDISGDYLRAATGVICKVIKMDNGLYITDHVGGSTPVPAYFVTPDTTSFAIPVQTTFGGLEVEGTDEVFVTMSPVTMRYRVMAAGFGTGLRTFVKQ